MTDFGIHIREEAVRRLERGSAMRKFAVSGLALLFVALRFGYPSLAEEVAAREKPPIVEGSAVIAGVIDPGGAMKREAREVATFTAVEAGGSYEIRITSREPRSVEVRAGGDALPWISTEVRNGTLIIAGRKNVAFLGPVQVIVSAPDIEKVFFSGSGEVHLAGVGNDRTELVLSGSGEIHAVGETRSLTADLSGSGDLNLKGLRAGRARVTISGSGSAEVYAAEELDATVSGSGEVTYYGNPEVVRKRVTGSGAIIAE